MNLDLPSFNQIKYALQNKSKRTLSYLVKAWKILRRFRTWISKKMYKRLSRPMKRIVKKIRSIETCIRKRMICMQPRLERRYWSLVYTDGISVKALKEKKKAFLKDFVEKYIKNGNMEDEEEVEYIEDCFHDMERPKFGWRVEITLKENEPCQIDFENPDETTCDLGSNTKNELLNNLDSRYLNILAQSRQTDEGFRSAAPMECRIEFCGVLETSNSEDQTEAALQTSTQPILAPVVRNNDEFDNLENQISAPFGNN